MFRNFYLVLLVFLNLNCQKTTISPFGSGGNGSASAGGGSGCPSTATLSWTIPTTNTDGSALTNLAARSSEVSLNLPSCVTAVIDMNTGEKRLFKRNLLATNF